MNNIKKSAVVYTVCFLVLIGLTLTVIFIPKTEKSDSEKDNTFQTQSKEMRGVWISYLEFSKILSVSNENEYTENCNNVIKKLVDNNLNTAVLQLRSHCDSYYFSDIFPWTNRVQKPSFDPLPIFLKLAHENGICVHGWINPFRGYSQMEQSSFFSSLEKGSIKTVGDGTYLNPAKASVRKLIIDGVREMLIKYDLDGIHIDDYFYPTTDESFDFSDYSQYKSTTDNPLPLCEYRRSCVNQTVLGIYQAVKSKSPETVFGISPCADFEKNYNNYYADVKTWLKGGFCDYICPQIYFGYNYPLENFRFTNLCKSWNNECSEKVCLYIGLAPYKKGKQDNGSDEWITDSNIIPKQKEDLKGYSKTKGYILFSYDYI